MTRRRLDASFPGVVISPERVLFRVHLADNKPIHFSSSPQGRFNLGRATVGTCYLAVSDVGAFAEVFGRFSLIDAQDVAVRRISELALECPLQLADFTDRTILGRFGITGAMSTGPEYSESHALAEELFDLGFSGVYYTTRHDPSFYERSIALFGRQEDEKLFVISTGPISDELIIRARREFTLQVLPHPDVTNFEAEPTTHFGAG